LYRRTLPSGSLYYAGFYEKGSTMLLADRSTGEQDEKPANIAAGKLLAQLPLDKLFRAKTPEFSEKMEGAERLKNMPFADYLAWFWNTDASEYIRDRVEAEKSLSKVYIRDQARYVKNHASTYPLFKKTILSLTMRMILLSSIHAGASLLPNLQSNGDSTAPLP
jgi:hypothetical protein